MNQFQIADAIRASVVAYPEYSCRMVENLRDFLFPIIRDLHDMYKEREIREGFLLGVLESVILMEKYHENGGQNPDVRFQKAFPLVVFKLVFDDGTNWDIKNKKMSGRISSAVGQICKGYGYNRKMRIGQISGIAKAMHRARNRFSGGWHHDIAKDFTFGLLGCDFVQDQLRILCERYRDEFKEWEFIG